jgi:hypothetical protein
MTEFKPVAWMFTVLKLDSDTDTIEKRVLFRDFDSGQGVPLYTAPPQRVWKDLTTAEVKALWNVTKKPSEFADLLQAKLRERNAWNLP